MSEIKSNNTKEQIEQYANDNNLFPLNSIQVAAKFMELEDIIAEQRVMIAELSKHVRVPEYIDGIYVDVPLFEKWNSK